MKLRTFKNYRYLPELTVKGKFSPITGHEDPEGEKRYNSTLSLTTARDGDG
jgi:hypothetical protein